MVQVIGTDEFIEWFMSLTDQERDKVAHVIAMLEIAGVNLGFPYTSAIQNSRHPLRELRPNQGRSPLRVFYAFDSKRDAVLLIGGDKGGDKTFYRQIVPRAERIWEEYLEEQASGLHDEE